MPNKERVVLKCETCGSEFERLPCQLKAKGSGRFCSTTCMWEWRRHGQTYTCTECGNAFYRRDGMQSKLKPGAKVFCCRDCYSAYRRKRMKGTSYQKAKGTHRHLHRVLAERALGRALRKGEVVHHINGDFRDHRIENLSVLPSQRDHAIIHFRCGATPPMPLTYPERPE